MTGYLIFGGCMAILVVVYLVIRKGLTPYNIDNMIFGDRETGSLGLTLSIFAAWMWTTSVFGSAETYSLYGVWGPVSYVLGACIAFGGLIGLLAFLRSRYPMVITWVEFIRLRYGRRSEVLLYIFAVVVPSYVLIEQGVGIAYVLETFYGSSFRIISFFSVIIATAFVFFGGMKTVLAGEKIAALIIIAGFAAGCVWVASSGGPELIERGAKAEGDVGIAGMISISALQYFIVAIVIAFGQIAFDPAYYIKAKLAGNMRSMVLPYVIGGIVIWGTITLVASLYMGRAATLGGVEVTELFKGPAKLVFSVVIIVIGMSTIAHFMIGLLGTFSLDLHGIVVGQSGSERDRIVFGRILIIAVGVACASITIALENISLLTIDTFCAIFFAAPCVALVFGCLSERNFGRLPIISTIMGIIGGLAVWMAMPGNILQNQFAGLTASILITLLIMLIGYVRRMPFDR